MENSSHLSFEVEGLSCASCVGRAEKALNSIAEVKSASVNLSTSRADVELAQEGAAKVCEVLNAAGYPAATESEEFAIEGLSCASCVSRVERAALSLTGVLEATVNLATSTASVKWLKGSVSRSDVALVISQSGYEATPFSQQIKSPSIDESREHEAAKLKRDTIVAALFTLPVFAMEMGSHFIPGVESLIVQTIGRTASWSVQWILATIVLLWPGQQLLRLGFQALWRLAPEMNALVALGTTAAWVYSSVALFAPTVLPDQSRAVYFEAAAVIVTLILFGRWMEARAKIQTGSAIKTLLNLQPQITPVWRDNSWQEIPVEQVTRHDVVLAQPGARIAVDGTVIEGHSFVDESMITGEPVPVERTEGDEVIGGTVNGTGALQIQATTVGDTSVLAGIVRMVEQAQGAKLPIQSLVDKVVRWFVPAVLVTAGLTAIIWLVLGPSLSHAMVAGVSVLIVACPCAMGLATPTSVMVGTGRAAELGVLFRKGSALQTLSQVRTVAFDKTGTLTAGQPEVTDFTPVTKNEEAHIFAMAAAVEVLSEHPISSAIVREANARGLEIPLAAEFSSITGLGLEAKVDGKFVLIGSERLMVQKGVEVEELSGVAKLWSEQAKTPVFVSIDGALSGVIAVSDPVKPEAAEVVSNLQRSDVDVVLVTGDTLETANAVAKELGIKNVVAGVMPEGKADAIETLKQSGTLAFVGDGINDAPALASADVGVAVGTGTDVAIETADVVLMSGELSGVARAISISNKTMNNIRQNLFWAFAYNTALIPVAAGILYPIWGVLMSPMLAAGAMAMSSVFVVGNALRLRRMEGRG